MTDQYQADPGRGVLILVLGILGIIVCGLLAPVAWVMGNNDLQQIANGQIAQDAKGLTQAGMICGIVGTVLLILQVLALIFIVGFGSLGALTG